MLCEGSNDDPQGQENAAQWNEWDEHVNRALRHSRRDRRIDDRGDHRNAEKRYEKPLRGTEEKPKPVHTGLLGLLGYSDIIVPNKKLYHFLV